MVESLLVFMKSHKNKSAKTAEQTLPRHGLAAHDHPLHRFQNIMGNQALQRLLLSQAKPSMSEPGDVYGQDSNSGRLLLAHELTHAVQQSVGRALNQRPPASPDLRHDNSQSSSAQSSSAQSSSARIFVQPQSAAPGPIPNPDFNATTEATLRGIDRNTYQTENLCYMETIQKLRRVVEAYVKAFEKAHSETTMIAKEDLRVDLWFKMLDELYRFEKSGKTKQETKECAAELERQIQEQVDALVVQPSPSQKSRLDLLARVLAFTKYAKHLADGTGTRAERDKLVKTIGEGLSVSKARQEADRLYHLSSSQTDQLGRSPTSLRGAGVGGALVALSAGEIVYDEEIRAGKLKPGATIQWWFRQSVTLTDNTTVTLDGKGVYKALVSGIIKPGTEVFGHSLTFVAYKDRDRPRKKFEYIDNSSISTGEFKHFGYLIGANLSIEGGAKLSAEYILQKQSRFRVEAAVDNMRARARRYHLDAVKLATALIDNLNLLSRADAADSAKSSERSTVDETTLSTAVKRLGTPSEFNHDLVRLVGLWQLAAGLTVDGDFGNNSSRKLVGKPLSEATALQVRP